MTTATTEKKAKSEPKAESKPAKPAKAAKVDPPTSDTVTIKQDEPTADPSVETEPTAVAVFEPLTTDVQVQVAQISERINLRLRKTAEDIVLIGQDLNTLKEILPHGSFMPFVQEHFDMGHQSALNFMNVAARFAGDTQMLGFAPTALYELAAANTSEEVIEAVKDKKAKGETPTVAEIKTLKAKVNEAEKAEKAFEKEKKDLEKQIANLTKGQEKLNAHIDKLQSAPSEKGEVVEKIVEKEVLPKGFTTAEEAVKAMQDQQRTMAAEIKETEKQLKKLQSSDAAKVAHARAQVKSVYDGLNKALGLLAENQSFLTKDAYATSDPECLDLIGQMSTALKMWSEVIARVVHPAKAGETIVMVAESK